MVHLLKDGTAFIVVNKYRTLSTFQRSAVPGCVQRMSGAPESMGFDCACYFPIRVWMVGFHKGGI
jgi:hypothetical protein